MKTRWIFYLLGIVFIIFFILFVLGLAMGQDFPYKDWNIVSVIRIPDGIWSIFLQNPKDATEIVMIILIPIDTLFFKQPLPELRI